MRREHGSSERSDSRGPRSREDGERGGAGGASAMRRPFFRRRKSCPFTGPNAPKIDWKDTRVLIRYLSERGKIMPSRISAVSSAKQRELANAVKRARFMGLLPYVREGEFS
jgi:small subunit ribosomal protein S18